jgi:hypothetical protein
VQRLDAPPERIVRATSGLHHSSGYIVGVGVARPTDSEKCWLYFPEESSPFYRVTYLSNYSPYITPDANHMLLLTETSYSEHKPEDRATIVDRVIEGLVNVNLLRPDDMDRIVTSYLIDVDYSYPVPTVDRNLALATIQPYLMERGIYSRGRFGAWEYEIGNMDHSVMQGVELVNHWLLNEPETTWKDFSHLVSNKAPALLPSPFPVNALQAGGYAAVSGHGKITTEEMEIPLALRKPKARRNGVAHRDTVTTRS